MKFSKAKIKNSFVKSFSLAFFAAFIYWFSDQINQVPAEKELEKHEAAKQEISGIARVIDGDSIVIEKNRIRLDKIDAPEIKQKCLDVNDEKYDCGIVSKQFLINLIGKEIVSCFYEKKDIYDRFLAICYVENFEINKEILKNGMAIIYDYSNVNNEFLQAEEEAKVNKIGIWQGAFQRPKDFRKSNKNKNVK